MKILIATVGHFHDHPGGSPKVAFDEAVELTRRGHDVWMIARGEELLPEYEMKDGIGICAITRHLSILGSGPGIDPPADRCRCA